MSENTQPDEKDVQETLEQMRQEYRERTGHELPDHVIEYYDDFFAIGPTADDIHDAFERGRDAAPEEFTKQEVRVAVGLLGLLIPVAAAGGFGVGLAIAESLGMAVVALVAAGVGLTLGGALCR